MEKRTVWCMSVGRPGGHVVEGSVVRHCGCGQKVWAAPTTQDMEKQYELAFICDGCCAKLGLLDLFVTPETRAEAEREIRKIRNRADNCR